MDYEKKYNEALEWMRDIYPTMEGFVKEDAEHYFPQLRESEDERMLHKLIDHLDWHSNNCLTHEECDELREWLLTYLEKHKEQEKYDRMQPVYDNLDSFDSALAKAWKAYNDSGARIVDGCEDNYVECAHAKGFREGYLFGLEKQKEQKPLEWSEEDKNAITTAIRACRYMTENFENSTKQYEDAIERLKSLRPSWKPSEEQIDAIVEALKYLPNNKNEWMILNTLVDALRKLM